MMRYNLSSLFVGLVFVSFGAFLLASGVSITDSGQVVYILAGATSAALGLFIAWTAVQDWWEWKKEYKRYRDEQGISE